MITLKKQFKSSIPLNKYDKNILKLIVYGTAYVDFYKIQNKYDLIDVNEHFVDSLEINTQTLFVTLTLQEKEMN